MLHRRRQRLKEIADREAAGEAFWTDKFDIAVRTKILHAAEDAGTTFWRNHFYGAARGMILRDEGLQTLTGSIDDRQDLLSYLLKAPDNMVPTIVEALSQAFASRRLVGETGLWQASEMFDTTVATALREHRISFDLTEHEMVEFSSRELHVEVVAPALRLLAGRSELSAVEDTYQDALKEISQGNPGNAITDAGTALQELLTALGCEGNALGPLIKSARAKGLLAAHDAPMLDFLERTLSWVSADRSQMGDAHKSSAANVADAWFVVHVVGAIILRLADGSRRS